MNTLSKDVFNSLLHLEKEITRGISALDINLINEEVAYLLSLIPKKIRSIGSYQSTVNELDIIISIRDLSKSKNI